MSLVVGNERPVRVLHVVGSLNQGGVETWLLQVLRHIDRERYHFDFLVETSQPCAYDEEVRGLGSLITPCLHPSKPIQYAQHFKRILGEREPYDVIHSHIHHFSGFVLYLAKKAGIPLRIAHSHNDTRGVDYKATTARRLYLALMKRLIDRYSNLGFVASAEAAIALFGKMWQKDRRWKRLYYGIDLAPFRCPAEHTARQELNIPADALVIGHVGRFYEQKNHTFLIDIMAELSRMEPRARLLLVGDGPLRPAIKHKVAQLGLADKVIFAGLRTDIPRLMKGAMDVFVFPSLYEGLGIVLIEARASGLPALISDVVPKEADVVIPLIHRLSLTDSPKTWAENILVEKNLKDRRATFLEAVARSDFNVMVSVRQLEQYYRDSIISPSIS